MGSVREHESLLNNKSCVFCSTPADRVVAENLLASAIHDKFPVTDGHLLVIPKRHAENYFSLTMDSDGAGCDISSRSRTSVFLSRYMASIPS